MKHVNLRAIGATTAIGLLAGLGSSRALAQSSPPSTKAQSSAKPVSAAQTALFKKAEAAVDANAARLTTTFKDIHQHPEIGFMELRTAGIVAKELAALGFGVKTGIGKTGVVGILRNGAGPTVMYRADMDANAVEEASGFDYASKVRVKRMRPSSAERLALVR